MTLLGSAAAVYNIHGAVAHKLAPVHTGAQHRHQRVRLRLHNKNGSD